jgi:hypothetical protein
MKKFLVVILAVALIAFFAMPKGASAAAKMIWTGDYQVFGVLSENIADFDDDAEDQDSYVTQRFRLTSIAATENAKGVLGLEIGWDEWGKTYSEQSGLGADDDEGGDTGIMVDTNSTNIEVRMAYIDFTIPDTTLSISAGKQPLYTHGQTVLTAAAMSPGVQVTYGLGEGRKIKAWWAKFADNDIEVKTTSADDDDFDVYCLEYSQKAKTYDFGVYHVYAQDKRTTVTFTGGGMRQTSQTANPTEVYKDDLKHFTGGWVGFTVGPVKLGIDAIYQYGERDYRDGASGANPDKDYDAWYARVDASMNVFNGAKVAFSTIYATGDDNWNDNDIESFSGIRGPSRYPSLSLMTPGPNLLYWGNGVLFEEYSQVCLPPGGYGYYDGGGLVAEESLGRWFTMLGITVPIDKLKLIAKYWYLSTVEDPGDALTANQTYRDKDIGHEIDLEAHYQLTKNLRVAGEADYLFAGDYCNNSVANDGDDAWKIGWNIRYTF